MSALIDIWTREEMANMREKSEKSTPSCSSDQENTPPKSKLMELPVARMFQFKSEKEHVYSEATISMIMESICP
ncbi:hypothetical protein ACHQM5_023345 [Ranunculus cassubicifolius]